MNKLVLLFALLLALPAHSYTQAELDYISYCFSHQSECVDEPLSFASYTSTLTFRDDDTRNPSISRDGAWISFNRVLGGGRRALWQDGSPLGTFVTSGSVRGISSTGRAVGVDSSIPFAGGFILPLFTPLYERGEANDISADGERVVGGVFDADSGNFGTGYLAVWDYSAAIMDFGLEEKNAVNFGPNARLYALTADELSAAGSSATGDTTSLFGTQAILFDVTTEDITLLPFGPMAVTKGSEALSITDDATALVGWSFTTAPSKQPILWNPPGSMTGLPLAGGFDGVAYTIAADGSAIGGEVDGVGVVWDGSATYVRPVSDIAEKGGATIPAGCVLETVSDMNAVGDRLVGNASCFGVPKVYELGLSTPVPEPDFTLMLCVGLGVLVGFFVSRQRSR